MRRPLLLLTRPVDEFILGDHARELLATSGGAVALPGRIPYGGLTRAPAALRGGVARGIAAELRRQIPTNWCADETVLIAYHAIQWPAVAALMRSGVASEVWYCRWDLYEQAHDAGKMRALLVNWNEQLAAASSLTFCVSDRLAEIEHQAGRQAICVGLSADDFPDGPTEPSVRGAELIAAARAGTPGETGLEGAAAASIKDAAPGGTGPEGAPAANTDDTAPGGTRPEDPPAANTDDAAPGGTGPERPVAVSLGHLGRRTDWAWLRGAVERVPELTLLLIGRWYEDEVGHDADYRWLRESPQAVWLGGLDDADAAEVIAAADAGLVPFTVDPFNEAGLPTRIVKYARLGRRTILPPLAGSRTWARACDFVDSPDAFAAALREAAGARYRPDAALRTWALEQTAAKMNAPLHERLRG